MTSRQYNRLLVVVALPLLLVGLLLSSVIFPFARHVDIRCRASGAFALCQNDLRRPLAFQTADENTVWVDLSGAPVEDRNVSYVVEAEAISLGRVTVTAAYPDMVSSAVNPRTQEIMQALEGRPALMRLGAEPGERSFDNGREVFLFCRALEFDAQQRAWLPQSAAYLASCAGDDWEGYISFEPGAEARQTLTVLRDAVDAEIGAIEREYWLHRVALTLAPLFLFLVISALTWLTRRASAFVRAG